MSLHQQLRRPDWPERLARVIEDARSVPFEYGVCDCVVFSAAAVRAVTGADVLGPLRGGWSSGLQAARMLRRRGGLMAAASSVLGPADTRVQLAQRGDVVLIDASASVPGDPASAQWLAVCDGARWWCPAEGGLAGGHMARASAFWPVGWGVMKAESNG